MTLIPGNVLPPLARTSLGDSTADLIRERIFAGTFGPGSRLVEADLARQLQTSRAPVREALAMLRAEGLAREEPGRGTYVASLGRRDIEEIYEVRAGLESVAARLIIERNDGSALTALDRALGEMRRVAATGDRRAFADADIALHGELCAQSGNGRLMRAWTDDLERLTSGRRRDGRASPQQTSRGTSRSRRHLIRECPRRSPGHRSSPRRAPVVGQGGRSESASGA